MKEKALRAHVETCLVIAKQSRCPRRQFGAVLVDPKYNSVVSTGYNGPPRGEEGLCGGRFCIRDGLREDDVQVTNDETVVRVKGNPVCDGERLLTHALVPGSGAFKSFHPSAAKEHRAMLLEKYPPIPSGTRLELGCQHSEQNCISNAARRGAATEGTVLVVGGEPCLMCAKYIHHAGVVKVYVVGGGYAGGTAGVDYLRRYGVEVEMVDGPKDPRLEKSTP